MEINILKNKERIKFKKIREEISIIENNGIKRNVDFFLDSINKEITLNKYLAIFWPLKFEVDLRDLKKRYQLALPNSKKNKKIEYYIWDNAPLVKDLNGIPTPDNNTLLNHQQISYIFVPCLSIDKRLTRLGYGGGYFDKLRSDINWRSIPCIGVLPEKCVSETFLTKGDWDIPLNGFITEKRILI